MHRPYSLRLPDSLARFDMRMRFLIAGLLLISLRPVASIAIAQADVPGESAASDQIFYDHTFYTVSMPAAPGMAQDAQGFLWMSALRVGLYKYDGSVRASYTPNPSDTSLAHPNINDIVIDDAGIIWLGTDGGLSRFDPVNDTFKSYTHNPDDAETISNNVVDHLLIDRQGVLWLGTNNGLNRYNESSDSFTRFMHDPDDPSSLSYARILHLYEDRAGVLWVGTGPTVYVTENAGGLNRFDPSTGTFTQFLNDPNNPESLPFNQVSALYEDVNGVFWVGTGNGLYRMDRDYGIFLDAGLSADDASIFEHASISAIHETQTGHVWIGRFEEGVSRLGPGLSGASLHYTYDPQNPVTRNSPNLNFPYRFFESRDGTLWIIGYEAEPVKVLPSLGKALQRIEDTADTYALDDEIVACLLEDRESSIWIGTRNGQVFKRDPASGALTLIRSSQNPQNDLVTFFGCSLEIDQSGDVWMATEVSGGLEKYEQTTNRITTYWPSLKTPYDPRPWPANTVNEILKDHAGRLWVGTNFGIAQFAPFDVAHPFRIQDRSRIISNIHRGNEGSLWMGTETQGFKKIDLTQPLDSAAFYDVVPSTTESASTILPKIRVDVVHQDRMGVFWLGTTDGLYRFEPETGQSERIDGLPLLRVRGIEEDGLGFLWITAAPNNNLNIHAKPEHAQLWRFDLKTRTFALFSLTNYIDPIGFADRSTLKGKNGVLLFGGQGGILQLDPSAVIAFNEAFGQPVVHITNIELVENIADDKPSSLPTTSNLVSGSIELFHDQNDFSFEFATFDYQTPGEMQYQYRMLPVNAEWLDTYGQQRVRFTGLTPKNYTFEIRAINGVGTIGESTRFTIEILPPWWKSKSAAVAYIITLLGIGLIAERAQRKRYLRREREKAKDRELAQAREIQRAYTKLKATQEQLIHTEKMASLGQLTAGIAHEIKNPLNFINNFSRLSTGMLEEMKEWIAGHGGEEEQEMFNMLSLNAKKINEHGQRADRIVESMMQHAKGATAERRLVDLNALVNDYVNLMLQNWKGLEPTTPQPSADTHLPDVTPTVSLKLDPNIGRIELAPQDIGRVLINLLDNAFDALKTNKTNPAITIHTRRLEKIVKIEISDNGPGIADDVRAKIFEPFFTTKPTGSGTGLGLSLSYDIVTQGHAGKLEVFSEQGEGATFVVSLPVG